jgi:hypothetical protein
MDKQDKIEKYILNRMSESEKADFEIDLHNDPLLKEQVELERQIVEQIRNRAFVDEQINQAKEELNQKKFESYLRGQMTETEKTDFENELQNDPLLKEQLELEHKIVEQIQDRAFVDEQIVTAKKEMKKGKTTRMIYYSVASIAASFLLFFFGQGIYQNNKFDNLYASNFKTYTNDYVITDGINRGDVKIDSLLLTAMSAYEKKDYANAEIQFNQLLSEKDSPNIRFYLAIAQLETNETEIAIKTLDALHTQSAYFDYYEQTRWYLALAHLKNHKKSTAKKYLNELVAFDGNYLDEAKNLLDEL